jgi:hypothetical protein
MTVGSGINRTENCVTKIIVLTRFADEFASDIVAPGNSYAATCSDLTPLAFATRIDFARPRNFRNLI